MNQIKIKVLDQEIEAIQGPQDLECKSLMEFSEIRGVYIIWNRLRNKCYVGSSIGIGGRWLVHRNELRNRKHNKKLQNSYNKHGESAFQFHILEICEDLEILKHRENWWIQELDSFHNGYNGYPTAFGGMESFMYTDEMKLKQSNALKKAHREGTGKLGKEEWFENVRKMLQERNQSEEQKEKIRNSWTDERKEEQSERFKKYYEEHPERIEELRSSFDKVNSDHEHIKACAERNRQRNQSEEFKAKIKEYWSKEENRKKKSEIAKEVTSRPEVREKMIECNRRSAEIRSLKMKEIWSDEEKRRLQSEKMKSNTEVIEKLKERNQSEEFKEKLREANNKPEVKERRRIKSTEANNRPEVKAKHLEACKRRWMDPEARKKASENFKANTELMEKLIEMSKSEERRTLVSESWKDPERRKARIEKSKATKLRNKQIKTNQMVEALLSSN